MALGSSNLQTLGNLIGIDLLRNIFRFRELENAPVGQITFDSREIVPHLNGAVLFFAVNGSNCDGHSFIGDVFRKNSQAIVVSERDLSKTCARSIWVSDIGKVMAIAAKKFANNPDEKLRLIAITGTDGKTTTAHLCRAMLNKISKTGMFGTVEHDLGDGSRRQPNTTLAAIPLFKMIKLAWENGCENLAMEISSHGIMEKRTYGLEVDVAVFTNLSPEHLDFHKNIENYFLAKKNLFDGGNGYRPRASVINCDDEYGRRLCEFLRNMGMPFSSFGLSEDADFRICNVVQNDTSGTVFHIKTSHGSHRISSHLFGNHNLLNIAASFASCMAIRNSPEKFIEAIGEFARVPGRMDRVNLSSGAIAFVDYAHTPRALQTVLRVLDTVRTGKLICVFGCGGNRDSVKRAPMTQVANELADFAICTSDNPRGEPQERIFSDMRAGVVKPEGIIFIADRREAIGHAMAMAREGDAILVAGKGHETHQLINGKFLDFDDKKVIEELDSSRNKAHF
ncbi:MAG: UDP-N-acetylmuramoyl-L-alanyl-D-glutamate--2,6-diaminopimelate ligase [Puniceicoccales bacterium]|jgi:UDP-N-acetylmuramoyl-L-alanyl-D-glutamate--2,6-diaminopimelate ligase|nr:UDP-N-acetylmuramoyl-L-alanyl-D-glutamate--2,6-diaminopimelate ligase [Puniceicoccales bacterium]